MAKRMSRLGSEEAMDVLGRAEALKARGRPVINLGVGAPDFRTPRNIVEAGRQALADGWHGYTAAKGIAELREAVVWDIHQRQGVNADPDHLIIVPGGKPTVFFALLMLGEPGVEIMYPDPGFPIYRSMVEFSGATPIPIKLEEDKGFSFDPDRVLRQVNERTRLIILNSPANPTGGIVGRAEMDALVAGLADYPDVYVMSDEIYSRIVFGGAEHVSLLEYDSLRDRLIVLNGWSKTWAMTGWRLGWGLWPSSLVEGAERLQINSNSCANAAVQIAAIEAIRGPQDEVNEMVKAFEKRSVYIADALDALPGVSCQQPGGAFYVFPNISGTGLTSQEMQDRLLDEADVAVVAGTSFGAGGEGHIRISCAASLDELEEAVGRIETFLGSV
jgi:aspartate/methionine/tyrosine aminotransferase